MAPPPFMPISHRQLVPTFDSNAVSSPLSNDQITIPAYVADGMGGTYLPNLSNPFQENSFPADGNNWMDFEAADANFDHNNAGGSMNPNSYVNVSRDPINQNMLVTDAEIQANWEQQQIPGPPHMQYNRRQQ